jgi:LDH2 family malate/lactate/ureidoglycolate dehydrogenase
MAIAPRRTDRMTSAPFGASCGVEPSDMVDGAKPGHDGQIFIAIEAPAFQTLDLLRRRVDGISRQIQASRRASGVELYPPGLLEAEYERTRLAAGIPLNNETLTDLVETRRVSA